MSEPCRWAPRAQVDNITVTIDCVWVSSKTLFTAGAKQSAVTFVITAGNCSLLINLWKHFSLARKHTCSSSFPVQVYTMVLRGHGNFLKLGCRRCFSYIIHWRNNVNPKQHGRVSPSSVYVKTENSSLIGRVFDLHTACAVDFVKRLCLNKRIEMNSSDVLRARSWDGFHKQITQVVHLWEREWSTSWETCLWNHGA